MTARADPAVTRLTIVGGAGAVGSMLAASARAAGDAVTVIDPGGAETGEVTAGAVLRGDVTAPTAAVSAALADADTVVLAVPEQVAEAAVPLLDRAMRPDALLVETLSVKSGIHALLRKAAPQRPAVGINPMFAPSLGMTGRPVAAVVHHGGPAADRFLTDLAGWGGRVVRLDADDHDRVTAVSQAMTHAAVLAFGLALADTGIGIAELAATAPPPHRTLLALLARIGSGAPEVYHDIQVGNPYAVEARRSLVAALTRLAETVERGSEADFARLLADSTRPLGDRLDEFQSLCAALFRGTPAPRAEGAPS